MRQEFVTKALQEYHQRVVSQMRAIAVRKKIGVTNEGINSLAYQVYSSGQQGGRSSLSFREYLRFVDMGVGRGHPLGGLKATVISLKSRRKKGIAQVKDNTRKKKTFLYSKIAYGNLGFLTNHLMYGYSEEAIQALKEELQKSK